MRTSGSSLGFVWLLLYPLLFLSMYTVVFIHILGVRIPGLGTPEYVLTIFSGLVPFLAFSEAFGVGTQSLVANRSLLRNTLFPVELVVARDVIVGHASMGIGMVLVWAAAVYMGYWHWSQAVFPAIFLLQILFTLGVVWISATVTVFFRDLQYAAPIIILFMMLVSPIAYTSSMVPESLQPLLIFNPLARLMFLYRAVLMDGYIPIAELAIFALISLAVFYFGFYLISRLKSILVDYV